MIKTISKGIGPAGLTAHHQ